LHHHLPALIPTTNPIATNDPRMTVLISQVAEMNDTACLKRVDRRALRAKAELPTSVRERFQDHTTDKLLRLTEVQHDEDLPSIYHELAAQKKGMSKRLILQHAFDITRKALNLNQLLASPSHIINMESWDWFGTSVEALGTGMLPFSIIPPDAPSKEAQNAVAKDLDRARQHDMSGENVQGAMSPSDAKKFYNTKGHVPRKWAKAEIQTELHAVMLGTVLGSAHSVTTAYVAAFTRHQHIRVRLNSAMHTEFGSKVAPALLVFYFQLLV